MSAFDPKRTLGLIQNNSDLCQGPYRLLCGRFALLYIGLRRPCGEAPVLDKRRRRVIGLIAGAVAWPLAVSAQQPSKPVIGFLNIASPETWEAYVAGFKQGLAQAGFVEGDNVAIEYRWARGQYDRL